MHSTTGRGRDCQPFDSDVLANKESASTSSAISVPQGCGGDTDGVLGRHNRQDGRGVVFLMNVTSIDEARELLESLPFGQAKLLKFDLLPLGPLSPLQVLLNHPQAARQ